MYVCMYVVTLIFVYTKCSSLEGGLNVVKLGGDYRIVGFGDPIYIYIYWGHEILLFFIVLILIV